MGSRRVTHVLSPLLAPSSAIWGLVGLGTQAGFSPMGAQPWRRQMETQPLTPSLGWLDPGAKSHPLGLSPPGTHSSALPSLQMHPSAAQPPPWSPAPAQPSPRQPGKPWDGSCRLSRRQPALTSLNAPSSWPSLVGLWSLGSGRAGAAACRGRGGACQQLCHGGSATVGRWLLAAPCPPCLYRLTPKVGMCQLPTGSPVLLLTGSVPLGTEGSRDSSTQHWVLLQGCQGVRVRQAAPCKGTFLLLFPDNRLTPRLVAPRGTSRRAVSVHEEQLREPECPAELGSKWGLEWDPKPPLYPMLEETGGGSSLTWWCHLSQLSGAGVMYDGNHG